MGLRKTFFLIFIAHNHHCRLQKEWGDFPELTFALSAKIIHYLDMVNRLKAGMLVFKKLLILRAYCCQSIWKCNFTQQNDYRFRRIACMPYFLLEVSSPMTSWQNCLISINLASFHHSIIFLMTDASPLRDAWGIQQFWVPIWNHLTHMFRSEHSHESDFTLLQCSSQHF